MAFQALQDALDTLKKRVGVVEGAAAANTTALATKSDTGHTHAELGTLASSVDAIDARSAEGSRYVADGTLTNAYVTYVTESIVVTARPVVVMVSILYRNGNSGANRTVDLRVQQDGVTITNGEVTGLFSELLSGGSTPTGYSENWVLTPTAGTRSFTLQIKASANSAVILQRASLVVIPT